MNFCTAFSKTHEVFFKNHFLKTFPFTSDVSLTAETIPQACKSGHLFASGWRDQMILKEKFILKCLTRFHGQICVFCDVDIQFYAKTNGELPLDLENCLGDNDICFLKDHADQRNGRGAGFFVLRSNPKTVDFFSKVLKRLEYLSLDQEGKGVNFNTSEQGTINDMLSERKDIRWNFLPERYYTHGKYTNGIKNPKKPNGAWWDQKDDEEKKKVFIPDPILVHHANWCTGVKNKIHLLDFVEKVVHDRLRGRCYRD